MCATVLKTRRPGRPLAARPIADDLIPRIEIARQFNVSEHTLRSWELTGRGPPTIRVGKRFYYRTESVRGWLLDQETGTAMT